MRKKVLFLLLFSIFCGHLVFADSTSTISYFFLQEWEYRPNEPGGDVRVQMDVTIVDNRRIEVSIIKDMTPFGQVVEFTTEAVYESGKYIFAAIDGHGNSVFGHIEFEEPSSERAILFLDAQRRFDGTGLGNMGRLFGSTHIMIIGVLPGGFQ